MIVKICGLRQAEHALAALEAGADWLGLVFAPSRRRVTPAEAGAIAAAVRAHPRGRRVRLIGLFVNEAADTIDHVAAECDLDCVQLSGDEPPAIASRLKLPLLKSLRLIGDETEAAWLALADQQFQSATAFRILPLVDAYVAGSYGGSGQVADWTAAAQLARRQPLLLAGGLHAENVAAAVLQVQPCGVDVSSGVETDGVKDPARIADFVAAVRRAMLRQHSIVQNTV
jgi:phosphoribosylanthranilate isomerase